MKSTKGYEKPQRKCLDGVRGDMRTLERSGKWRQPAQGKRKWKKIVEKTKAHLKVHSLRKRRRKRRII